MRIATFLARSRASFLMAASSFRTRSLAFDLLEQPAPPRRVLVQPEHHLLLHLGHDPGAHLGRAELVLGLALEDGILQLHRDRADDAVAHVLAREALLRELVHALEEPLAEGALVRAAVVRVLAVDEAEVGLAVVVGVWVKANSSRSSP